MSHRYKPYMDERIQPDGTLSITEYGGTPAGNGTNLLSCMGALQLGRQRFAWLVTITRNWFANDAPDAFGYAVSLEEAERQMTEARKPFAGCVAFRNVGTVRYWHRELVQRGRKPNQGAATDSMVEYVWNGNGDVSPSSARPCIFIKSEWHEGKCDVIDRQQFEQTGEASTRRGSWPEMYYREPPERGDQYSVP